MASTLSQVAFSDKIIKATELNRKSGSILTQASSQAVTIVRNDEYFTLVRREEVTNLVAEATHAKNVFEVVNAAFFVSRGGAAGVESPYGWLRAFDSDEIQDFVTEVLTAYRSAAVIPNGWDNINTIIHEWHESAITILSGDLDAAMSSSEWDDEEDEVLLTPPSMDTFQPA